ncbi:MAG: hypothetical protein L3J08_08320, partial [Flavobacteriaceae bacterium]|nr:hypothetical protein [Flavobacteriaceae bacterium]
MRHILKSITVILLVFNFTHLRAQTDTINFTLTSETVNTSGQDIAIVSTITKSENALVWAQNNSENTEITNFIIS